MSVGRLWPDESRTYRDAASGVTVRQLTNYKGHSHHFYFTNPGWYDGGRRMLFASDRENRTNLFSLDLQSFEILQLTDLASDAEAKLQSACLNPVRPEVYFWHGRTLKALDLATLDQRNVWEGPEGFWTGMLNATADGQCLCTAMCEDLSSRFTVDLQHGYVGFREVFEARPLCRLYRILIDGGSADVVWEDRNWLGHVNTSPTQPHLLTFCHEGPWDLVRQRIWGLDLRGGDPWPVRPQQPDEAAGHEYWLPDGLHIGYHGWRGESRFFGCIRYDNAEHEEMNFPFHCEHFHSLGMELVVGDDNHLTRGPHLLMWRRRGEEFEGPRVLAQHRSSRNCQQVHVHPCFTPDGSRIVFTTDRTGYGNIYLVDVPPFESLPMMESE